MQTPQEHLPGQERSPGAIGHDVRSDLVPPPPRSGPDFPTLDALRALGALAVLTTHVAFWAGDYTSHGTVGALLARLDVGVAIFFVLSGFLLARPWLAAAADARPLPATGRYLGRRFWRITPLYVLTAVLALALIAGNRDLGWAERLRTVLLVNTFHDQVLPDGLTQMWSLAVEVTFYLLLPVLMMLMVGRGPQRLSVPRVLAVLLAMVAVTVWWYADGAERAGRITDGLPLEWLPAYLSWFAVGIGLALVQVLHERGRRTRTTSAVVALAAQPGSCWALVAGLLLVAASPVAGPTMFSAPTLGQELTKSFVYAAVATLIVLTGVFARPRSGYTRALSHPVARRLGWISFGVFCLHLPLLHLIMWLTGWQLFEVAFLPLWLLTIAVSLVAAELAYRLVERPGMRLGDRLRDHWGDRRGRRRSRPGPPTSSATSGTTIA